jgi:hypothetical protein
MSISLTLNGSSYIIPTPGELGWGSNLDAFFVAIPAGCLQKTGGSFTLTAETNFGTGFGLKTAYLKSQSLNIASTGILRLANGDSISWRDNLNTLDIPLSVNSSNQLTFNGNPVGGTLPALTINRAVISNGSGALAVSPTTSTEIGYVSGVTGAIQTQLGAKKTTATGNAYKFETTDITGNLQETTVTPSRVVITDSNGLPSASSVTDTTLTYLDISSSLTSLLSAKGSAASPTFTGDVTLQYGDLIFQNATNSFSLHGSTNSNHNTLQIIPLASNLNTHLMIRPSNNGNISDSYTTQLSLYGSSSATTSNFLLRITPTRIQILSSFDAGGTLLPIGIQSNENFTADVGIYLTTSNVIGINTFTPTAALHVKQNGAVSNVLNINDSLLVANSGVITQPYQPCFRVYIAFTKTAVTGDGTPYPVIFDTIAFDTGSHYNTGTGIYTAAVTGKYFFSGILQLVGLLTSHTRIEWSITTSSSDIKGRHDFTSNPFTKMTLPISGILEMNASDSAYVTVTVYSSTKVVDILEGYFTGSLIN